MADHPVERLGGQTPLQYADTPYMDMLARKGRTGRLMTIPTGFAPGSEVANSAILGYDLNKVYEGRGPLEAASIGYEMQPGDMAMRCNIITLADRRIKNHHGGHLTTEQGDTLIKYLDSRLGNDRINCFRHLKASPIPPNRRTASIHGKSGFRNSGDSGCSEFRAECCS